MSKRLSRSARPFRERWPISAEEIPMSAVKEVQLYAHGRVSRSSRTEGHWSCHLQYGTYSCKDLYGDVRTKSEGRSELVGIVTGLEALKCPCSVEVKTANDYILDCGERLLRPKSSDPFVSAVHRRSAKNGDIWQPVSYTHLRAH